MARVGHQTESVHRRYAIVEERMLSEAGAKLQSFYDGGGSPERPVVPLPPAGSRKRKDAVPARS